MDRLAKLQRIKDYCYQTLSVKGVFPNSRRTGERFLTAPLRGPDLMSYYPIRGKQAAMREAQILAKPSSKTDSSGIYDRVMQDEAVRTMRDLVKFAYKTLPTETREVYRLRMVEQFKLTGKAPPKKGSKK